MSSSVMSTTKPWVTQKLWQPPTIGFKLAQTMRAIHHPHRQLLHALRQHAKAQPHLNFPQLLREYAYEQIARHLSEHNRNLFFSGYIPMNQWLPRFYRQNFCLPVYCQRDWAFGLDEPSLIQTLSAKMRSTLETLPQDHLTWHTQTLGFQTCAHPFWRQVLQIRLLAQCGSERVELLIELRGGGTRYHLYGTSHSLYYQPLLTTQPPFKLACLSPQETAYEQIAQLLSSDKQNPACMCFYDLWSLIHHHVLNDSLKTAGLHSYLQQHSLRPQSLTSPWLLPPTQARHPLQAVFASFARQYRIAQPAPTFTDALALVQHHITTWLASSQ